MERTFEKELEELKNSVHVMGTHALVSVEKAIATLVSREAAPAQSVLDGESAINDEEMFIEDSIIHFTALHQPVAVDLRFLLACLKVTNDLERIGDHAVNIAESAQTLALNNSPIAEELFEIASATKSMLRDAISAFQNKDAKLAQEVLERDDIVDAINRQVTKVSIQGVKSGIITIEDAVEWIRVSKNLERIADLSTNLAEEAIFYVKAKVVKHHLGEQN